MADEETEELELELDASMVKDIIEAIEEQKESWSPESLVHYGPARRTIAIWSEITNETVLPIISQIIELEHRSKDPIRIHLNTDGGSLSAALALYDTMRMVESKIVITATGMCASAGLLILAGGDKRFCTKNAQFFYHQPVMQFGGEVLSSPQMSEIRDAYSKNQTVYDRVLRDRFAISDEDWSQNFDGKIAKYFYPDEALSFGFVDEILPLGD